MWKGDHFSGQNNTNLFLQNLHKYTISFPVKRLAIILDHQHDCPDITCKPAIIFIHFLLLQHLPIVPGIPTLSKLPTVILRGCAGYELIYITNEAVGRVGYYQLISGKSEKNNCFSKFSSNSLDFFGWNLLKWWHFLYRRCREKIFSNLQNFSTRNSPSVFPYLVTLNDNGSYHGLREPIRKLENHYPELKIY